MDDALLDAVAWGRRGGIADPARVAIMGRSYGGCPVQAGITRNPELYVCGFGIVGAGQHGNPIGHRPALLGVAPGTPCPHRGETGNRVRLCHKITALTFY